MSQTIPHLLLKKFEWSHISNQVMPIDIKSVLRQCWLDKFHLIQFVV